MVEKGDQQAALYQLYLATAEKVSDRRTQANTWMLSVNSALATLFGVLDIRAAAVVGEEQRGVWFWVIPVAGILVCIAWASLLTSYSRLNAAKFDVLQELEKELSFPLFTREQEIYKAQSKPRRGLATIEHWVPWTFAALYAALLLAVLVLRVSPLCASS